ncbi:MAG: 50S ribosomal protein L21 [Bacteroidetes bacterium GWE2_29_8]|nr:MAG: 50S ribosomal protein L21 [Bacteroidetes bacterium GWE2_29_8]OFY17151.1 MAG: 50S ribosomal protein L21 [Bacteroidetes bacterium GWF2_29_10]
MLAIVDIAGQQFKITENQELFVHRLNAEEGENVEFGKVLLIDRGNNDVIIGQPIVEGAIVKAKVISHERGDKILIFKKKRRKSYQKMNGHRQCFSKIQIESISI